jgi:hypothetical protein
MSVGGVGVPSSLGPDAWLPYRALKEFLASAGTKAGL